MAHPIHFDHACPINFLSAFEKLKDSHHEACRFAAAQLKVILRKSL
jgi:hypothetical protein